MAGEVLLLVETRNARRLPKPEKYQDLAVGPGCAYGRSVSHGSICPIKENDWCHFACRIPRGKLHRQFKEGEAPFEDEKFAYLAMSKKAYPPAARVSCAIRRSGRVMSFWSFVLPMGTGRSDFPKKTANGINP
jgi:hypothetical protein